MTRSKVKVEVTRPLKLEILQFSKSISSGIFNVSWQMTTDSETMEQYLNFVRTRLFDICPSFVSRDYGLELVEMCVMCCSVLRCQRSSEVKTRKPWRRELAKLLRKTQRLNLNRDNWRTSIGRKMIRTCSRNSTGRCAVHVCVFVLDIKHCCLLVVERCLNVSYVSEARKAE